MALGLYLGLLAQGFGAFWGLRASDWGSESETLIAQTAIVTTTKQCVHHRVACPPQCFCPPLNSGDEAHSHSAHDNEHATESAEGENQPSDLQPGDLAFETCHSAPLAAVTLSGIPAHLLMNGHLPYFSAGLQALVKCDVFHFENIDPHFPDKVPILSAV